MDIPWCIFLSKPLHLVQHALNLASGPAILLTTACTSLQIALFECAVDEPEINCAQLYNYGTALLQVQPSTV